MGLALSKVPVGQRSPNVNRAINACVEFLTSVDPASAEYTHPGRRNLNFMVQVWFPVFYITDLLQILETLTALGLKGDKRLKNAVDLVLAKRDKDQRWPMEYTYIGKTWYT